MASSGLQELLEMIYASNAVVHMLTGKAITGKQGMKYGTVSLTVSLRDGTSENSVFQWIFRHN